MEQLCRTICWLGVAAPPAAVIATWTKPEPPNTSSERSATTLSRSTPSQYQDSVCVWTIGYGHTAEAGPPTPKAGMKITEK